MRRAVHNVLETAEHAMEIAEHSLEGTVGRCVGAAGNSMKDLLETAEHVMESAVQNVEGTVGHCAHAAGNSIAGVEAWAPQYLGFQQSAGALHRITEDTAEYAAMDRHTSTMPSAVTVSAYPRGAVSLLKRECSIAERKASAITNKLSRAGTSLQLLKIPSEPSLRLQMKQRRGLLQAALHKMEHTADSLPRFVLLYLTVYLVIVGGVMVTCFNWKWRDQGRSEHGIEQYKQEQCALTAKQSQTPLPARRLERVFILPTVSVPPPLTVSWLPCSAHRLEALPRVQPGQHTAAQALV